MDKKPYRSLSAKLLEQFGEKVYKVTLDGGMTCPNRDGKIGRRGCIFCSAGGSGDFAASRELSITEQINEQIASIQQKRPVQKFIAYFQAYTNTYAPEPYLRQIFTEALAHPQIVGLSIGTRPDCLPDDVLILLDQLNHQKPVWAELGLQTIHQDTAEYIRRGYDLACFEQAVKRLRQISVEVIVHTILGLPGEDSTKVLETISYLNKLDIQGIKLQLLHVLKGTDLAKDYLEGKVPVMTMDEYLDLLIACIEHLRPNLVIHRLTGDGPKELLLAPTWSSAKRTVLNTLHQQLKLRGAYQGRLLCPQQDLPYTN